MFCLEKERHIVNGLKDHNTCSKNKSLEMYFAPTFRIVWHTVFAYITA